MLFVILKRVGDGCENGCRIERPRIPGKTLQ